MSEAPTPGEIQRVRTQDEMREEMRQKLRELGKPERCAECGADWTTMKSTLAESYRTARVPSEAPLAAQGLEPPSGTVEHPVSYDHTLTCENDHEYSWTQFVN